MTTPTGVTTVHSVDYHRCTGCGKTLEHCDKRLLRHGTACCGQCHQTDTHHNEDFDANCRRMALLREGVDWAEAYRRSLTDPDGAVPVTRVVTAEEVPSGEVRGGDLLVVGGAPARVVELSRTGPAATRSTTLKVQFASGDRLTVSLTSGDRAIRLWKAER